MTTPLVSVIMPVFNCEKYISEAIKSIIHQTYPHWELLIGDDASTDKSLTIAKSYSKLDRRIKVFENSAQQRVLRVRNQLLDNATGDLITFQDADDYSHKQRFERMIAEFHANHRLGLLASQVGYVDINGILLRTSKKPTNYADTLAVIGEKNVVGGAMAMITRAALESVGGKFRTFLDGFSYQDYDLSMLIAEKHEAYALPDVLYYYRQHGSSTSKIVHADRAIARDVVLYLFRQRRERGFDDVMAGEHGRVLEYFDQLREPYRKDPSLVYREYAAQFMFNRLYWRAIATSWLAVSAKPLKLANWRTLQYCIRKYLIGRLVNSV